MDKLGSQLFEFQKITYEINIKLKKEKLNRPKLAKISNELISEMFLDKVNLNQLKNDMDLIRKNTNLQLMDSKINSKKRAN
ncbi:hypothetical protein BAA08_08235 [Bizionia sp. APA-3]|nr:hypothetical protein BAA08_08235 [Bizionia sp. APA-3]